MAALKLFLFICRAAGQCIHVVVDPGEKARPRELRRRHNAYSLVFKVQIAKIVCASLMALNGIGNSIL
jgi:hypothetical protein